MIRQWREKHRAERIRQNQANIHALTKEETSQCHEKFNDPLEKAV
jgi:hypothetical protein